jgi:hypothetical protein
MDELKSLSDLLALRATGVPLGIKCPCVYFLFKEEDLVYIGRSRSLIGRVSAHMAGGRDSPPKVFDSIACIEVPDGDVGIMEMAYIKHYKPLYNRTGLPPQKKRVSSNKKESPPPVQSVTVAPHPLQQFPYTPSPEVIMAVALLKYGFPDTPVYVSLPL